MFYECINVCQFTIFFNFYTFFFDCYAFFCRIQLFVLRGSQGELSPPEWDTNSPENASFDIPGGLFK